MTAKPSPANNKPPIALQYKSPIGAQDIRDTIVIKELDLFLITNLNGNVPRGNVNGLGLYFHDTRFLSAYELGLEGINPIYLLSTGRERFSQIQELTNPDLVTMKGTHIPQQVIRIQRKRIIGPDLWEEISLANFHDAPLTVELSLEFDADFADMFVIRGLVTGYQGTLYAPEWTADGGLLFRYLGIDQLTRTTRVEFDPPPTNCSVGKVSYILEIPARGEIGPIHVRIAISPGTPTPNAKPELPVLIQERTEKYQTWLEGHVGVSSDNPAWDDAIRRARFDLRLLESKIQHLEYPAAGIPWYVALFGRDSLITSLQTAWFIPRITSVLRALARFQGQFVNDWKDEQPGKILHELRRGDLADAKVIPFSPNYGTVDATILFVILLQEYYQITGDVGLVQEMAKPFERALTWMEKYGDVDGDGLIEYQSHSPDGLRNQGWKDSWDAIMYEDGSLVEPPIALVEVQGYAYAARRAAAVLYRALQNNELAAKQDYLADWLRDHFDASYWMPDKGCYCLALDKDKRQAKVVSSNAGQALWSGIAGPERAKLIAERMMQPDMFSGWGIRTLSAKEVRYNPMGYHIGTVWPHDNSLIAFGFKRYAEEEKLLKILSGLFDVAGQMPDQRLPELICGYMRIEGEDPVRYPVACSPQAWSSGVFEFFLRLLLGLQADAPNHTLRVVRPRLPGWIRQLAVTGIPVGSCSVDLACRREGDHTYTEILKVSGDVKVSFVEKW
ncbi:MAG TPA: glycogen debranching N-terminal domain-containing protein [Chloroflexota bacterium]|nr:glycogen debranching N-terminal domain-containing protein [Chloroflexota bacterium]